MQKTILKIIVVLATFIGERAVIAQDTIQCDFSVKDTLLYVYNKNSNLTALSINNINEANTPDTTDGYIAYGQLFEAPDSLTLEGYCFYAFMYSGTEDTLTAKVYQTNLSGGIDSLIDSVRIAVPLRTGYNGDLHSDSIKICVDFPQPLRLKGDYVITLENNTASDMYIVRTTDGQQEDLAFTYYYWANNNAYDGWYKTYSSFGALWDFDVLIEPIVSYKVTSQHVVNSDSHCFGDTLKILSSQLWLEDSLMTHRMYNPNYTTYSPIVGFSYFYGDTTVSVPDTFHIYQSPGGYNAMFIGGTNFSGWTFTNYAAFCNYYATAYQYNISLGSDTSVCHDSLVLTPGQYFDAYEWSTGDTTDILVWYPDSVVANNPNNPFETISVTTILNGCKSYDTITLMANSLSVNLIPEMANYDTVLCLNQQLMLTTNYAGTGYTHEWSSGQLTDSILIGPFNAPDTLNYVVMVFSGDGCMGEAWGNVVIDNCLGIENYTNNRFEVYPNPAQDYITIKGSSLNGWRIMDINGRVVLSGGETNTSETQVNLELLESGIYIVELFSKGGGFQQKLQIIK